LARQGVAWQGGARRGRAGQGKARFFYKQGDFIVAKKWTIVERSIATAMLVDLIAKGAAEYSYADLSRQAGGNVQAECYGNLATAVRVVRKEHGLCYQTVRNVGIKLMESKDAATTGMASITKMHREARRGMERMGCADLSSLDNNQKIQFNAVASGLGAIGLMTQPKAIARLETAVAKHDGKLALADTLKEFGG